MHEEILLFLAFMAGFLLSLALEEAKEGSCWRPITSTCGSIVAIGLWIWIFTSSIGEQFLFFNASIILFTTGVFWKNIWTFIVKRFHR